MTTEQILKLAETCGFGVEPDERLSDGKPLNYWECDEEQLLKFAQQIRKQTIDEILTSLKEVPNPDANRTAINRIMSI